MAYNYVVTAQKPTAVTHSLTAAFTGPDQLNLILIKSTRLEIHTMGPEGLVAVGGSRLPCTGLDAEVADGTFSIGEKAIRYSRAMFMR
jgi:hypothetical protein